MSPLLRRLVALAVVLLLVVGVGFLTLRGMGYEVGLGPSTPAPIASPTSTPIPSAGPSASVDPQAAFAAIEEQIRSLRVLPRPTSAPPR